MEEEQAFDAEEAMNEQMSAAEEPAAAMEGIEQPPVQEEPEAEVEAPELMEEKPPSRLGRFLRRLLRWAVGVMVIFVLGIGALWVTQLQPLQERVRSLQDQLASAQAEVETLGTTIDSLRSVEAENATLQAELEAASSRLDILSVLVDVTTAQLAIAQDEPDRVSISLSGTEEKLDNLEARLSEGDAEIVRGLRERVALVLEEVDSDIFAAERDLEVLANSLLELDRDLFGQ